MKQYGKSVAFFAGHLLTLNAISSIGTGYLNILLLPTLVLVICAIQEMLISSKVLNFFLP